MFIFQGECKGFRDVLKTYTRVTPTVKLHRPTNFAPLIYKAIEIIQNTGKVCVFTKYAHTRCWIQRNTKLKTKRLCARAQRWFRLDWAQSVESSQFAWSYRELQQPIEQIADTLIRLGGWPDWSESALGAQNFIIGRIIWAMSRENLSSVVCEQQRRRPACASAQSDQRLCYSPIVKYHIQTWYTRNFNFLASLCSWAGWFESRFLGNPEDRFSRGGAHLLCTCFTFFLFLHFTSRGTIEQHDCYIFYLSLLT